MTSDVTIKLLYDVLMAYIIWSHKIKFLHSRCDIDCDDTSFDITFISIHLLGYYLCLYTY